MIMRLVRSYGRGTRGLPARRLVRDHAADGAPEDAGRGAVVDGAVRGLGVHPLAEEAEEPALLARQAAGEGHLLAAQAPPRAGP
jgi:hypothetical protein